VFAEEGYHGASVSRIAQRANVSKGLMYNYFSSKEEVLKTLLSQLFDYAMDLLKIRPGEVLNDERFGEIIELSVRIPLEEPKRWKLYMSLAFQQDVTELIISEMTVKWAPYINSLSSYFTAKGHEDPMTALRIFSAVLDGIQLHCLLDPKQFPAEKAIQFLKAQFIYP
jgi:AcrR family transcriptional regulator